MWEAFLTQILNKFHFASHPRNAIYHFDHEIISAHEPSCKAAWWESIWHFIQLKNLFFISLAGVVSQP